MPIPSASGRPTRPYDAAPSSPAADAGAGGLDADREAVADEHQARAAGHRARGAPPAAADARAIDGRRLGLRGSVAGARGRGQEAGTPSGARSLTGALGRRAPPPARARPARIRSRTRRADRRGAAIRHGRRARPSTVERRLVRGSSRFQRRAVHPPPGSEKHDAGCTGGLAAASALTSTVVDRLGVPADGPARARTCDVDHGRRARTT